MFSGLKRSADIRAAAGTSTPRHPPLVLHLAASKPPVLGATPSWVNGWCAAALRDRWDGGAWGVVCELVRKCGVSTRGGGLPEAMAACVRHRS